AAHKRDRVPELPEVIEPGFGELIVDPCSAGVQIGKNAKSPHHELELGPSLLALLGFPPFQNDRLVHPLGVDEDKTLFGDLTVTGPKIDPPRLFLLRKSGVIHLEPAQSPIRRAQAPHFQEVSLQSEPANLQAAPSAAWSSDPFHDAF